MIKLRHTFLISILLHAGIFALMSPFILSMSAAGKKMTEQIIVELVEGVSKKTSLPVSKPAQPEEDRKVKEQVKRTSPPVIEKAVPPVTKPVPVEEPVIEIAANENEKVVEENPSFVESAATEEALVSHAEEGSAVEVKKVENVETDFDKSANYSLILEKIDAAKLYPRVARKRGIEGVTIVKFRIAPDGNAMDIMIDKASGFSILDNAAIKTIRRAAPFPFFDTLLKVAVTFKLT